MADSAEAEDDSIMSELQSSIESLTGVGPKKASLLKSELGVETLSDLIHLYPFRYIDRSSITPIAGIAPDLASVQIQARVVNRNLINIKHLSVIVEDASGRMEMVFFKGTKWVFDKLEPGREFVFFGKPQLFNGKLNMVHPEIDAPQEGSYTQTSLTGVYPSTEKLKNSGITGKFMCKMQQSALSLCLNEIQETLPDYVIRDLALCPLQYAIKNIHFPSDSYALEKATRRLKFEELFYLQLYLIRSFRMRHQENGGFQFLHIGEHFNSFYKECIPFELTNAQKRVLKEILRDRNLDEKIFPIRPVLGMISKAKDQMKSPKEFALDAGDDYRLKRIAELYEEYQRRLKGANAVDFDDIILLTVQLLQQFEDVRDYYQRKFRYVLIDEYQDTNNLQYLLASLLAGRYENICVVGDDDQSIYRFRGATIQNILDFEKQFHGAKTIRLEQNYRSTQCILDAANAVIANNIGRKGKSLWTNNGEGEKILHYEAMNESDEASFVANNILSESKGRNLKNFAVLYRTNAQSNALEYAFKRTGLRYRIIGGTRFFDRAEVKDMLAYLQVINNRSDDLRLKRIINQPPRGIGAKTVETIERICTAASMPLYSVVSDPYNYPAMERSAQKLMVFTVMIEECAELLNTLPLPDFYEEVLIRTGYVAMLEQKDDLENRTRLENVRELKSSILTYMENTDEPSLRGFLEEIALYTDIEQYDKDADAVVMMTMHSAKGLEFPNVYIVGVEEGLFPGMRSIGDREEMEEERRLCYVAITRAKSRLSITSARQRMLYGHTTMNRPSRFLGEIPEELMLTKSSVPKSFQNSAYSAPAPQIPRRSIDSFTAVKKKAPAAEFAKGDMVQHDVFGSGMVLSALKMGNDTMLEIAFDHVGTKRLMASYAATRMKKV